MRRFFGQRGHMPSVVYKDDDYIVIIKPVGMPSQADPTGDTDAMSATSELLRQNGERHDLWLVHRLDRNVGGLLAFARNKGAAAKLSAEIVSGSFEKRYYAVVEGSVPGGEMRDFLFKDPALSKSFVIKSERKGAKLAVLKYRTVDRALTDSGERSLVSVELKTGRFHQIRAQFSHRGHPLVGDKKYGSRDRGARAPALFACMLRAPSLNGGEPMIARPELACYPWSLFEKEKYI